MATDSRSLATLAPGERATVEGLRGQDAATLRLMEMGIVEGTAVQVLRRAPLGDPLKVRLRGYDLSLRRADAEQITVRVTG